MLPSEHLIVAFLPAAGYAILRDGRLPGLRFLGVVSVGSQFPDLVDKPLAHQFGVLPSGRVFMHSLPPAVPVLLLVGWYGWKTGRTRLAAGFVFGHLSHILADNYRALLGPNPQIPPDVFWPFTPPIARPIVPQWGGAGGVNVRLWTLFSVFVLSLLAYVLATDIRSHYGS